MPPTPSLDQLIRAAGRGSYPEALEVYRACYEMGAPLIPQIVEKIRAVDWKDLGAGAKLLYLTILMLLLHDIDESASRELTKDLVGRGCHPVVAARLRSIQAFTLEDFELRTHGPLTLYVANTLPRRETVWRHLNTWLDRMPAEDLEGISRLYVIEKDRAPGLWGTYSRVLSVISLIWQPSYLWNWFAALQTELTLYHEVGHHMDRRTSAFTETREAFADTYAQRIFRNAHPRLGKRWIEFFIMPPHMLRKIRRARRFKGSQADV